MRISDWSSDVCSFDLIERTAASARGIIDGDGRNAVAEVSGAARELKVAIGEARLTIADIGRQTDAIGTRTLSTVNATMQRSDERRVGKECVSTSKYRGSPDHKKKTVTQQNKRQ